MTKTTMKDIDWAFGLNLAVTFVIAMIIILVFGPTVDRARDDHNTLKAVKVCIYNPSYQGVTPEDNRRLFVQCLDDYRIAG